MKNSLANIDLDALIKTTLPSSKTAKQLNLLPMALRCLGLALRYDYLSDGSGHQHSRRVIRERSLKSRISGPYSQEPETESKKKTRLKNTGCVDIERRYLADIAAIPRLTSSEEYSLVLRMRAKGSDSRKAHDELISANLGLVVMFAYRYRRTGLPLLDLIAEGNIGLIKAAVRFNPELGYRFATYAKWWVRQSIQLALPNLIGVVRMPVSPNGGTTLRSIKLARGLEECSEFLSAETSLKDDDVLTEVCSLDAELRQAQLETCGQVVGTVFGDEASNTETIELLAIAQDAEPPGAAMAAQRTQVLKEALATLSERESKIIAGRFALFDDHVCTLQELSQQFGISIERVRQIANLAVKKLAKAFDKAGITAETIL